MYSDLKGNRVGLRFSRTTRNVRAASEFLVLSSPHDDIPYNIGGAAVSGVNYPSPARVYRTTRSPLIDVVAQLCGSHTSSCVCTHKPLRTGPPECVQPLQSHELQTLNLKTRISHLSLSIFCSRLSDRCWPGVGPSPSFRMACQA